MSADSGWVDSAPGRDWALVPGDEVMVIFSPDRMRRIGFPTTDFLDRPA